MEFALEYETAKIRVSGTKERPLFCGRDICAILGIVKPRNAMSTIDDEFKEALSTGTLGGTQKCTYVTEAGLYDLIFKSKKEEAKQFKKWVFTEVLPCIRKHGCYPYIEVAKNIIENNKMYIGNEKQLHYAVVDYIKKCLDNFFIIVTPLGELQDTEEKRIDAYKKGYQSGMPDLILLSNSLVKYKGIAIELKTPTGKGLLGDKQESALQQFRDSEFKIIVSNNYNELVYKLTKYKILAENKKQEIMKCGKCNRVYKVKKSYIEHLQKCL